jgi:hypothetical protein
MDKAAVTWLAETRLNQTRLGDELAALEQERQTTATRQRMAQIRSEMIALNIEVNMRCQQFKAHA